MSRLQDQEGRRVRVPNHGITLTDVKPSGLMAVRPNSNPAQKSKEGVYPNKKGSGCISISSVMVKAIKSALIEAAEYNNIADGKRRNCVGAKCRSQPKCGFYPKCNSTSPTRAPNKKTTNVLVPNSNKKKGSGLLGKLELISRMNMEGVIGPKSTSAMELIGRKGCPDCPTQTKAQKKKPETSPTRTSRSPTRKVQKDNSKRKSMIAVPAGSPDRKSSSSKKSTIQNDVFATRTTNQFPGCLEKRNHLSAVSLDDITMAKTGKKPKQEVEPDMTTYEFMRKLMSYSSTSFRDFRNERRVAKIPKLDAIPEES